MTNVAGRAVILIASAAFVYGVTSLVLDVRKGRRDLAQSQLEHSILLVRIADLQSRVDAQNEINRREELELLRHADQTQAALPPTPMWPREPFDTIEEEMPRWYDAGQPAGMSWGEFDRWYAKEQLRRQSQGK